MKQYIILASIFAIMGTVLRCVYEPKGDTGWHYHKEDYRYTNFDKFYEKTFQTINNEYKILGGECPYRKFELHSLGIFAHDFLRHKAGMAKNDEELSNIEAVHRKMFASCYNKNSPRGLLQIFPIEKHE
ncbi:MAG: hypothetical protein WA432_01460 [Candidatus Babeliaceae bacterium]